MKRHQRAPQLKSRPRPRTTISKPTAELTVEIELRSSKAADTVYSSLLPETKQPPGFRSRVTIQKRGRIIALKVVAQDIVALRASANNFIRFVTVALKTLDAVAPFYRAVNPD